MDCRIAPTWSAAGRLHPARPQWELRELTRYRRSLVQERSRAVNRIRKLPKGANIKLSSVATGVPGVSGRAMPAALAEGETDPKALGRLARGRVREKLGQLEEALRGLVGDHQRFMLGRQLHHLEHLEAEIEELDAEVARRLTHFETTVAAMAVAHSIAVIIHRVIQDGQHFVDLGHNYFVERDRAGLTRWAVRRLETLGHRVTLQPA